MKSGARVVVVGGAVEIAIFGELRPAKLQAGTVYDLDGARPRG